MFIERIFTATAQVQTFITWSPDNGDRILRQILLNTTI